MPALVAPVMKMHRAKEHLDALDKAIREFMSPAGKPKPYRVTAYDDLKSGEHVIKLEIDNPPLALCMLAGDFISNLRSSLDWLAWQLACIGTKGNPGDKVSFPIWGKYSTRAESKIAQVTVGIPAQAVAVMKSLQPYNSGNAYQATHLWRLHTLWNIEKHRHLVGHTAGLELFVTAPRSARMTQQTINDCGEVRFPLSAKGKVSLDPTRCKAGLGFGDAVTDGFVLTHSDLVDMYEFVSEKVVPRFKRFFS